MRAFLATGRAPHRDDLPLPSGIGRERALVRLAGVDVVQLDAAGRVVVAYPFSAGPTGHTVQLDGGPVLDTMCAIDALGIPLMTGQDGVIESADPTDGHSVRVERRGALWRWAPAVDEASVAVVVGQHGLVAGAQPQRRVAFPRVPEPARVG